MFQIKVNKITYNPQFLKSLEFCIAFAEFTIVSSSSSTLEEPVRVSEEPKKYNAKQIEYIVLRLPQK